MNANQPSEPLAVEDSMDLLVVLLYAPGKSGLAEPVDGITRLQKLMFLLQQGVGPSQLVEEAKPYTYTPYKMGPYSTQLLSDLEELKCDGIVTTERLDYWIPDDGDSNVADAFDVEESSLSGKHVQSSRFYLSNEWGIQVGADLWASLSKRNQRELQEFKTFFNALPLRQLLIFTYDRFPSYTVKSEIKDDLGF